MIAAIIITFLVLAAIIVGADVRIEAEGDEDTREAQRTARFVLATRAACLVALVAAIVALAMYEGP